MKWRRISPLLVLLVIAGCRGGSNGGAIPTCQVQRVPFQVSIAAEGELRAVDTTPVEAPKVADARFTIGFLAADGAVVQKGDLLVRFETSELTKQIRDFTLDRKTADAKLRKVNASAAAEIQDLDRRLEQARRELELAERYKKNDNQIFSRYEIVESELDEELHRKEEEHASTMKQVKERRLAADRRLVEIERESAERRIGRLQKALDAVEARATHDGIFTLKKNWRGSVSHVGDQTWPGNVLGEVADPNKMEALVYVLEADAGGLKEGQTATVILEAHPDETIPATVSHLDRRSRPRFKEVPIQYFGVTLTLAKTDSATMRIGSRVRARIQVADLSKAIVLPMQAVFSERNQRIAYRQEPDGGFSPVPLTVGPSSYGRMVIEKGLEEGDRVALLKPPSREAQGDAKGEERASR